ncbi:MAG TPA: glycosyltransferase family 1 protein [Gemmataceae bacterium]|nr:glycosyltransferase family 1 protein [Gemmataceae bacterium]
MRVLVNGLAAAGPMTGIGHYTTQLLRCLRQQADAEEIYSFPDRWLCRARSLWAHLRSRLERGSSPPVAAPANSAAPRKAGWRGRAMRSLRASGQWLLTRNFRAASRGGRYDLYHEPNYIPLPSDLPTVATVHDLSVLLHPEWHPADRVAHFERFFRRGIRQCVHFLAISEFARQEIIRTLHLRPEQVTRTYMGIRPGLKPLPEQQVQQALQRLGLPPRYLLYVGTIEPRKNIATLLHAYRGLDARIRQDYPLVLVGNWGWNAADVAHLLDAGGASGVIHLGYVPESDLAALYNGARALVFPSLYEGFGLPPVEMLACGGAVLASTAGAVAETVGQRAHLIESLDTDGWREAMRCVVEDDDWWHSLRRGAVEAARPFTWEQCAADTLRVYRQLAGGAAKTNHIQTRQKIAG